VYVGAKFIMLNNKPIFKYNPNAYELRIIRKSERDCDLCGTAGLIYFGPIYCEANLKCICVWCVKNEKRRGIKEEVLFITDFIDVKTRNRAKDLTNINNEIHNTPCFTGWQQEQWLTCCKDACAFIGYLHTQKEGINEWETTLFTASLEGMSEEELMENLTMAFKEYSKTNENFTVENIKQTLIFGHSMGYLFKCLHCNKYHIYIDRD
jgi:uncharacterized protein CbrC (UPF0167 family)